MKATVNNHHHFEWKTAELDVQPCGNGLFHLLHNGQSFMAELIAADFSTKSFTLLINQRQYHVQLTDRFDELLKKMGMAGNTSGRLNQLIAPMPGLVVALKIEVGATVNLGDPLLILEAMKMENVLKASGNGKVKSIRVTKGDAVEKGVVLIDFEQS